MRQFLHRATMFALAMLAVLAIHAALPAPASSDGAMYMIILQEECIDCGVCYTEWCDIFIQDNYTCKAAFDPSTLCGSYSNPCVLVSPCQEAYEAADCCPVNAIVPWDPCE